MKYKKQFLVYLLICLSCSNSGLVGKQSPNSWWQWGISFAQKGFESLRIQAAKHPYITTGVITALGAIAFIHEYLKPPKQPSAKDMRYSASMVHLTTMITDPITLTPKHKNARDNINWLWSNGKLDEKSNTYTVLYKSKRYTSTYDSEKQAWIASNQNKMDTFTYYNFLLDNNQSIEPFAAYLIDKLLNQIYENIYTRDLATHILNVATQKAGYKNHAELVSLLSSIITNEEKMKDGYVLYHSCSYEVEFLSYFIRALQYGITEDDTLERIKLPTDEKYEDIIPFLKEKVINDEHFSDQKHVATLKCCNIFLFGNSKMWRANENSVEFFITNNNLNIGDKKVKEIVEKIAKSYDIKNTDNLINLFEEYQDRIKSTIKQFCINTTFADKLTYPSGDYGRLFFRKKLDFRYDNITAELYKNFTVCPEFGTIKLGNILSHIRTYGSKYLGEGIDYIQARLLDYSKPFFDSEEKKKYGIKIYDYYNPEEKKDREDLLQKMKNIIKTELNEKQKSSKN